MEISRKRIQELEKAEAKLRALEFAGVDNWDGYDIAMEEIRKEEEFNKQISSTVSDIMEHASNHVEYPAGQEAGAGIEGVSFDYAEQKIKELFKKLLTGDKE